ncbi:hypothetical protein BU23DRAFT_655809 [Bimuria novae-zelandiae CBS 107.79]|uniref:F-box domain-containing protein n=1 Tax=Bimuria novae-zelandiae CBS 107.79 TaxID=1447943 RepID=A0A6A5UTM9_9PLEO|nr:hypothetical protein BU23DRAFT_655809 [Bimuria novae-zelandiae CBS 107.79]
MAQVTYSDWSKSGPIGISRLPVELILDITDRLHLVDIWALQLTCRHLATQVNQIVQDANKAATNAAAQYEHFLWRCREVRFDELASQESALRNVDGDFLCSWCVDLHAPDCFSSNEARKDTHERKCIGAMLGLCLCPIEHSHGHSFFSVKPFAYQPRTSPCERIIHPPKLAELPEDNLDSSVIKEGLVLLDEHICPHLKSSDPRCYEMIRNVALNKKPTTILKEEGTYWPVSNI